MAHGRCITPGWMRHLAWSVRLNRSHETRPSPIVIDGLAETSIIAWKKPSKHFEIVLEEFRV